MDKNLKQAFFSAKQTETPQKGMNSNSEIMGLNLIGAKKDQDKLASIVNRLAKSETGKKTLETMAEAGYGLKMEFLFGANGGTSKSKKLVVLNPQFTEEQLVGVLAHEARHVGQFERGEIDSEDMSKPRNYDIKSEIIKYRATEADAQATCMQALWELFEKDDIGPLRAFSKQSPEIADAYTKATYQENATTNGVARTAAFNAWYDNDKIKEAYEKGYQINVMEMHWEKGLDKKDTYDKSVNPEDVVSQICVKEDGTNYYTDDPKQIGEGKFVDIAYNTKEFLDDYFSKTKEVKGLKCDKSYKTLEVRPMPIGDIPYESTLKSKKTLGLTGKKALKKNALKRLKKKNKETNNAINDYSLFSSISGYKSR
jgi:hypothetical protein